MTVPVTTKRQVNIRVAMDRPRYQHVVYSTAIRNSMVGRGLRVRDVRELVRDPSKVNWDRMEVYDRHGKPIDVEDDRFLNKSVWAIRVWKNKFTAVNTKDPSKTVLLQGLAVGLATFYEYPYYAVASDPIHPHASSYYPEDYPWGGGLCVGGFMFDLDQAYRANNVEVFLAILYGALGAINPHDCYHNPWPGQRASLLVSNTERREHDRADEDCDCDDGEECEICGEYACPNCYGIYRCPHVCGDCGHHCVHCGWAGCEECMNTCAECGSWVCSSCSELCDKCGLSLCPNCRARCVSCETALCQSCVVRCRRCPSRYCQNCAKKETYHCDACNVDYCHDCGRTCDETGGTRQCPNVCHGEGCDAYCSCLASDSGTADCEEEEEEEEEELEPYATIPQRPVIVDDVDTITLPSEPEFEVVENG